MNLYHTDFHAWAFEQARRIRAGEAVDIENVAEELEDLGRSEQDKLESYLRVLMIHLLKWQFQPSHRSRSWELTIKEQRRRVARVLRDNPSLKSLLAESLVEAYALAILGASRETGLEETAFPAVCPYSLEQMLTEPLKP